MGMQWKNSCSTRILHVTLLRKKAGNIPWYLKMEYCGCLIKIFGWYPKILRVKVKKVSFSSLLLFNKPYNYVYHEYWILYLGHFTCPPVGCHYVDDWKEAPCSETCGGGHYNRYRHLNNSLGVRGLHCQNVIYEKLPCNQHPCSDTTIIVTISACVIICVVTLGLGGLYLYKKKYSKLDTSSFGIANNLVELRAKNEDP